MTQENVSCIDINPIFEEEKKATKIQRDVRAKIRETRQESQHIKQFSMYTFPLFFTHVFISFFSFQQQNLGFLYTHAVGSDIYPNRTWQVDPMHTDCIPNSVILSNDYVSQLRKWFMHKCTSEENDIANEAIVLEGLASSVL